MSAYETGCNSHCNNGQDCTEIKQLCRAPWPFPTTLSTLTEKQIAKAEQEMVKQKLSELPEGLL